MEQQSVYRHLISNQFDPTNHIALTREQLDEYNRQPEIVEKINNLLKEEMNGLKTT